MKKYFFFFFIVLTVLFVVLYRFRVLPIVLETSLISNPSPVILEKGDTICLFDQFDFDSGGYVLYFVVIEPYPQYPKVLYTADKECLKRLKEVFRLVYTGSDVATCESFMCLLKGDSIVLKMYMSAEYTFGLQSSQYGWLKFAQQEEFKELLNSLTPVYSPFVRL